MSTNVGSSPAHWHSTPVEINADIAFLSRDKRREHALKHVFGYPDEGGPADARRNTHAVSAPDPKKEQWRRVFGSRFVEALVALREGRLDSPEVQQIEEEYERVLSQLFTEKCREAIDHAHFAKVDAFGLDDAAAAPTDGVIRVVLACPATRTFAVAASFVTDSRLSRYFLLSGYRPWPELGGAGFKRRAREKMFRQKERARLIADHTQW